MDLLELVRTPKKQGQLVIAPSYVRGAFDSHAVDCPFPFFHEGKFWMIYIGWDGVGYQTGLAGSDDLVSWKKEGLLLGRGPKYSVTQYNAAMNCILRENQLYSRGALKRVDGQFVGTYHAYPEAGYEIGPAVIGLCYSDDLRSWDVRPPILRPAPSCEWEAGGLYKSWIIEHAGTYYLFYNAKNRTNWPWVEQTGFATSTDLVNWERFRGNPILRIGQSGSFDDLFVSDPVVLQHEDSWIMFYYGFSSDGHARDSYALSGDLVHWQKSGEILADVGPAGSVDSLYAHKPGIIAEGGKLHHFYCAVAPANDKRQGEIVHNEVRGISLATS
jgi:predicted GH43/DUF377 family glycosyl hydrolase